MKKFTFLSILVALLFSSSINAQEVLVVDPGNGTLNDAINTYSADKIYELKAGAWYGLTEPIENDGYHLQIRGQVPEDNGIPATLQTGQDAGTGLPFEHMFGAIGDITLKNIYIVNADASEQIPNRMLVQSADNSTITIDNCVIHPVGVESCVHGVGGNIKTYFTNNLAIDFGHMTGTNDGNFFFYDNESGNGLDILHVENNTFVAMGMTMFNSGFAKYVNNVVNFNHNTFVMTKSQIDWSVFENEQYWTNNLMFDVQTQPYLVTWQPMGGADPTMPNQI